MAVVGGWPPIRGGRSTVALQVATCSYKCSSAGDTSVQYTALQNYTT